MAAKADVFESLLADQREAMNQFCQTADIQIRAAAPQQSLRFNLFHVLQAARHDGKTGMGAKGRSREGYGSRYFWTRRCISSRGLSGSARR